MYFGGVKTQCTHIAAVIPSDQGYQTQISWGGGSAANVIWLEGHVSSIIQKRMDICLQFCVIQFWNKKLHFQEVQVCQCWPYKWNDDKMNINPREPTLFVEVLGLAWEWDDVVGSGAPWHLIQSLHFLFLCMYICPRLSGASNLLSLIYISNKLLKRNTSVIHWWQTSCSRI